MSDPAKTNQAQDQPRAPDLGQDTKKKRGILDKLKDALKPGDRDDYDPDKKTGRVLDDPDKKTGRDTLEHLKPNKVVPDIPNSMKPGYGDPGSTHYGRTGGTGIKDVREGGGSY
jgi:hypothetical protein